MSISCKKKSLLYRFYSCLRHKPKLPNVAKERLATVGLILSCHTEVYSLSAAWYLSDFEHAVPSPWSLQNFLNKFTWTIFVQHQKSTQTDDGFFLHSFSSPIISWVINGAIWAHSLVAWHRSLCLSQVVTQSLQMGDLLNRCWKTFICASLDLCLVQDMTEFKGNSRWVSLNAVGNKMASLFLLPPLIYLEPIVIYLEPIVKSPLFSF